MRDQTEIRHSIGGHGTFQLRSVSGTVRISATDGEEAVVIARANRDVLPELTVDRGPGSLLIEPPRMGLSILRRGDVEIDFDVMLPRNTRIDIKSVSADILASGLANDQDYKSVSGDLALNGVGGRLTVQTVSGDIHLNGGKRVELSATTTSGDVHVDAELVEFLRVRTVSGDVRMTGRLADGPRHTVETVSGDLTFRSSGGVTVEPARALDIGRTSRRPIVVGDGAASLSFRSMSGEERVTGPDSRQRERSRDFADPVPTASRTATRAYSRLEVLRALERGEIDIDEAARRLEEVGADA